MAFDLSSELGTAPEQEKPRPFDLSSELGVVKQQAPPETFDLAKELAPVEEPGYVETGLRSLVRGGVGLVGGAGAATEWAGDVADVRGLQEAGKGMQEFAEEVVTTGPGRLEGPSFEGTFMENPSLKRGFGIVGEAIPSLGAALVTGGGAALGLRAAGVAAGKALAIGTGAAAGGLGLVEGAPQYIEAKEAGKGLGEASAIGAAATVGTAALEYLGLNKILGLTGKGIFKGAKAGVVSEGIQEGTQQLWQNIVAKVGYDNSRSLVEGMAEAIIGGAGAGGIAGAVTGRIQAKQDQQKDRASEQLLVNIVPDAQVAVVDGIATITRQTETGVTEIKAPVDVVAKAMAAGVTVEELASATDTMKVGIAAAQEGEAAPEKKAPEKIYARLPDDPTRPDVLRYNVRGEERIYTAPEGLTRQDLETGIEGKSDAAAETWLKKNATLEETRDTIQQARDQVPTEVIDQETADLERPVPGVPVGVQQDVAAPTAAAEELAQAAPGVVPTAPPIVGQVAEQIPTAPPVPGQVAEQISPDKEVPTRQAGPPSPTGGEVLFAKTGPVKQVATTIDKDLEYHEEQGMGLHWFTDKGGTGSTFAVQDPTPENIKTALTESRAKFEFAQAPTTPVETAKKSIQKLPAFKKWFGESKVVDEKGAPVVVYHGTNEEFTIFDKSKFGSSDKGWLGKGFYLTNDEEYADSYADTEEGRTIEAYAQAKNPYIITDPAVQRQPDYLLNTLGVKTSEQATKKLQDLGYDSVILKYDDEDAPGGMFYEVAVFEPTQIKSVFNQGTFEPTEPDILKAKVEAKPKAKPRAKAAPVTGTTAKQVETELKGFLGRGYDNLVRRGKLEIVESLEKGGTELEGLDGTVVGAYFAKTGKIVLLSSNIKPGDAEYVMRHEAVHALLREDKVFVDAKAKILKEFGRLAKTNQSVKDAFAKVPADTAKGLRGEEALAYWTQNAENHNHALFKRIISAIKAALYRLGIAPGTMTTADMTALFSQGTRAWALQADAVAAVEDSDILFSMADNILEGGKKKLGTALGAISNPKSKLHERYLQHAPQWLSVTPLHTLVQSFGKQIPGLKQFAKQLDNVVVTKTEIVDTSAAIHESLKKIAEKGVGVKVLNKAIATASYNRMTPWLDMLEQEWVPDTTISPVQSTRLKNAQEAWVKARMQQTTGKTFSEAYHEAADAYKALDSKDLQEAYIKAVEHIKSIRGRERNNLLAYIESISEEGSQDREDLMVRFNTTFNNLQGAYWPLARFGDFTLAYEDIEGVRHVEHFVDIADRAIAKKELIAGGVSKATIKEDYKNKNPKGSTAIPQVLIEQLRKTATDKIMEGVDTEDSFAVAAAEELVQETLNDMNQIWLRWQPETSALKNSIRRKNVRGFSEDMLRGYLDYVQHHASNIAWSEHGKQIELIIKKISDDIVEEKATEGAQDVTLKSQIRNDLRNRINALRTVTVGPMASMLGKLGTAFYMTSPSIALVQMSQLGVLTFPKLAVQYGPGKAAKAIATSTKEAFSRKFTRGQMFEDPVVNVIYENMRLTVTDETRDTPQAKKKNLDGSTKNLGDRMYSDAEILRQMEGLKPEQRKLLILREAMARNLLDISAAHEAYELTRGKDPNSMLRKAFNIAMLPMSLSELASRKATVLATMDLAGQKGMNFFNAMDETAEVVNDTLHNYSKEYKGSALQGGIARNLLQFQHYRIMTGIRLVQLFAHSLQTFKKEGISKGVQDSATKEFIGIMGMAGALAGTVGLPMASAVFAIIDMVLGDDDEPIDSKLIYSNWLREKFGEEVAGILEKGLPTVAGADLSRRLGMGDLYGMQSEPPTYLHGKELAAWWAGSLLGPAFSVTQGVFQGYDQAINKGNYMRGLETALPKPIKDVLKSIRVATEGLKTGAGKKILADDVIGPDEIIMIALGFNADEISKAQTAEYTKGKISSQISARRGRLIKNAARAILEGGDVKEALSDIRTFNKKMPRFFIGGSDIRPVARAIIKGGLGITGKRDIDVARQYEVPSYL